MNNRLCILLSSAAIGLGALALATPASADPAYGYSAYGQPAAAYGQPEVAPRPGYAAVNPDGSYGSPPASYATATQPNPLMAPFEVFGMGYGGACHTVTARVTSFPGQLDWRDFTVCD